MIKFRNDFMKWHLSFIVTYTTTFILGYYRSSSTIAYKWHHIFGIATVLLPLVIYLILPNKRLIRQMIKVNFSMKGSWIMRIARISTQVILAYFIISALTGVLMKYELYGNYSIYKILSFIHGVSTYLVPLAVVTHVVTRLIIKKSKKKT